MTKNGKAISKFCKEAIHIAEAVPDSIRQRIYEVFEKSSDSGSAFPLKNGCPYSYELLPSGKKQLPQAKAPYWDGKDATYKVIRQFCKDTPIVSPLPVSALHITISYSSKVRPWPIKGRPGTWF